MRGASAAHAQRSSVISSTICAADSCTEASRQRDRQRAAKNVCAGATMTDVLALRQQLHKGGYCPIPLYGKEPPIYGKNNARKGLDAWQTLHDVTPEQIELWSKM